MERKGKPTPPTAYPRTVIEINDNGQPKEKFYVPSIDDADSDEEGRRELNKNVKPVDDDNRVIPSMIDAYNGRRFVLDEDTAQACNKAYTDIINYYNPVNNTYVFPLIRLTITDDGDIINGIVDGIANMSVSKKPCMFSFFILFLAIVLIFF
jgi:hypothetical protein